MKRSNPLIVATLLLSVVSVSSVFANAKKHRAVSRASHAPLETYPAVEGDGFIGDPDEIAYLVPVPSDGIQEMKISVAQSSLDATARTKTLEERLTLLERKVSGPRPQMQVGLQNSPPSDSYDQVPAEKTEMILKRLRVTEEILKKTGRAYDYRKMTTSQLEATLKTTLKNSSNAKNDLNSI